MAVCGATGEKCKQSVKKLTLDSRYLAYECNNRICDLLSLLSSCKKNIIACLINKGKVKCILCWNDL